jgi:uncharacterized protein
MAGALRVVLDTNVLLSGLAYPTSSPGRIIQAWRSGAVEVVLSTFILEELRRVLPRLRHRHGLSEPEIDDLVDILSIQAEVIEPTEIQASQLRDQNDLPILATLIEATQNANVSYLISGDKDLLALATEYLIISPAAFCERHGL